MSRELPARPNLEFLKKQAKDLLAELQLRDPSAQLSAAQYQLARDYGFDSWPKMKAHVESLEVESGGQLTVHDEVVRDHGAPDRHHNVLDQGTYEVSRDGQTLTIRGDQQVAVFDRG